MQLCNVVGISSPQFSDVRPLRARRSPCSCSNGCSTSGKPDLCIVPRREAVKKGSLVRKGGPRLVRLYALTASQVSLKNSVSHGIPHLKGNMSLPTPRSASVRWVLDAVSQDPLNAPWPFNLFSNYALARPCPHPCAGRTAADSN